MLANNKLADMEVGSREHIEFSRLLVSTIQEYAIFLLDVNGNIATWNPGAQKLKGYLPSEIVGRHFSVFYPKKDVLAKKPEWELEVAMREGHVEDEGWRVRKDGTKFWANVVITALKNDDGELIGFAKVTRDLSERKKYEEELRQANLNLRKHSAELLALNKAKDEFISLASHQLRTPASGVKQFLGLVLEGYAGDITEKQKDFLTKANESNDRQIKLINDLLRVAQLDAGKIVLKKISCDVSELIKDVVGEQRDVFERRKQKITLSIPRDPVLAKIDPTHMRMVFENLVDNASKYTPEGGELKVIVRDNGEQVSIAVIDSGVGIDEDSQIKLFKKFSRIPNDLSEKVGGTGLGLYWVHKLVQLHEGSIQVKSDPNVKTTFTVTIPKRANHA